MTYETALALFAVMPIERQDCVTRIFDLTRASFEDVRHAFVQAVTDECYVVETEMRLLEIQAPMVMQ